MHSSPQFYRWLEHHEFDVSEVWTSLTRGLTWATRGGETGTSPGARW
jgi:hypothetical protein